MPDSLGNPPSPLPTVVEQSGRGERFFEIDSRLRRDPVIFWGTRIDDQAGAASVAQLPDPEPEDPARGIQPRHQVPRRIRHIRDGH